jgi:hypothetical protein
MKASNKTKLQTELKDLEKKIKKLEQEAKSKKQQTDTERNAKQKQTLVFKAEKEEKEFEAMRTQVLKLEQKLMADKKSLTEARTKVD